MNILIFLFCLQFNNHRRSVCKNAARYIGYVARLRNQYFIARIQEEIERVEHATVGGSAEVQSLLESLNSTLLKSGTTIAELVHVMAEQCTDLSLDIVTCSLKTAYETCRYFRTSIPGGSIFADELSISGMSAIR